MEIVNPNRAISLKTQNFDSALSSLSPLLQTYTGSSDQKLLLQAESLYWLQRFRECSEVLKILCKDFPNKQLYKTKLMQCIGRLIEQQKGIYKFDTLYTEAQDFRPPILDHATYVGPVEVRESPGRDRGLFTTTAVNAGDLLSCEKAFSYSYTDGIIGVGSTLSEVTRQKLAESPSLIPAFSSIHHGSYSPVLKQHDQPLVDTKLIERVITLNSYGSSRTTLSAHISSSSASGHGHGIWVLAAHVNHSCFSNCRRSFIGDMMIIRASQDLPANVELVFPYRNPAAKDHDYNATQKELDSYGFICACALCSDAKSTSTELKTQREKISAELGAAFATGAGRGGFDIKKVDTQLIESVLAKIEKTYKSPATVVPRTGLWDPYLALTRMHALLNCPRKCIWGALKILDILGFEIEFGERSSKDHDLFEVKKWGLVVDYLVECWVVIWTASMALSQGPMAQEALNMARLSYMIVIGENDTFEETYGIKGREFIRRGMVWSDS